MKGISNTDKICSFCGNKNFNQTQIEYIYKHNGNFFIVYDVPCEECEYCGEQYFKSTVLKRIEHEFKKIYISRKKPAKKLLVPVEEYKNL